MKPEEVAAWFAGRDRFLLVTHRNPDGDTMGSAAALCSALRRAGKTAYLFPNKQVTEKLLPLADYMGVVDGNKPEKMEGLDLEIEKGQVLPVPVLMDSPVTFELEVKEFLSLLKTENPTM